MVSPSIYLKTLLAAVSSDTESLPDAFSSYFVLDKDEEKEIQSVGFVCCLLLG